MPEPVISPPEQSGTEEQSVTMESAYTDALKSLEQGTVQETKQAQDTVPAETTGTTEESLPEESEHIKWVKSIDGDYDKEKNEINVDRVAKRAYELNRQAQAQAQRLTQLDALLNHPEIARTIATITGKMPAPPVEPPQEEKTDEQILEDWVNERINKAVQPLVTENQVLFQEFAANQMKTAYEKLKEEFGTDDHGVPLYDSVKDQIGQQIFAVAQNAHVPVQVVWNDLIKRGTLYSTLSGAARNILYPKLQQRVQQAKAQTVQEKKKTNLTPKGTSAQAVKPVSRKVASIFDAAREAEEQNPEFKELV